MSRADMSVALTARGSRHHSLARPCITTEVFIDISLVAARSDS